MYYIISIFRTFEIIIFTISYLNAECGGNVTGLSNGVIHSPKFPEKYAQTNDNNAKNIQCHWFINVTPGHRILLYFETFEVEGNPAGIYLLYISFDKNF